MKALGLGLAVGIGAAVVWRFSGAPVGLVLLALLLAGLSFGLALDNPRTRWAGLVVGVGPFLVALARLAADPLSHNLLPFELASALAVGMPPSTLGVLCGHFARRLTHVPEKAALVTACIAMALVALSPALSLHVAVREEDRALFMLKRLWEAEQTYAAKSPLHRFTCEGPLLAGFEREPWFAWTELGLQTKDHMRSGDYVFLISCGTLSRGDAFRITAQPTFSGGAIFSIDESGAVNRGQAAVGRN